jgi:hypothetical protein
MRAQLAVAEAIALVLACAYRRAGFFFREFALYSGLCISIRAKSRERLIDSRVRWIGGSAVDGYQAYFSRK